MTIRYNQIEALRAVIVSGSISGAAKLLNKAQPSISRFILDLEKELGFQLFERASGKVIPTDDCIIFYKEVERVFFGLDHLEQTAHDIRNLTEFNVSVATIPAISFQQLPQAVVKLREKHSSLSVKTTVHRSSTVIDRVRTSQSSLGICNFPITDQNIKIVQNYSWKYVVVLPPNHELSGCSIVTLRDLQKQHFVSIGYDYLTQKGLDQNRVDKLENMTILEAPFSFSACSFVMEGLGVAIVDPITADFFKLLGLHIKPLEWTIPYKIALIQSAHKRKSRAVDELIEIIQLQLSNIHILG